MEEQVKISEAKYRSIFENTGSATAIIEADMTMSLVNSELEKLTGFSKKEIEGKKKMAGICLKGRPCLDEKIPRCPPQRWR